MNNLVRFCKNTLNTMIQAFLNRFFSGQSRSNGRKKVYLCTTKVIEMLKTILITMLIVAICIALLSIKMLLKKNGRFPNTHVSGSKAMRERGIGCVQSQDRAAQTINPHAIAERAGKTV